MQMSMPFGDYWMKKFTFSLASSLISELIMVTLFKNDLNYYRVLIFIASFYFIIFIFKYIKSIKLF